MNIWIGKNAGNGEKLKKGKFPCSILTTKNLGRAKH